MNLRINYNTANYSGGDIMFKMDLNSVKDITAENKICAGTILKSVVFAYIITIITFFVFAIIITYSNVSETTIPIVVIITTIVSIIISSVKVGKKVKTKGWLNGALSGLTYALILYIISSLAISGFSFDKYVLCTFILGAVSGAFGGILGVNVAGKGYRKGGV